MKLSDSLHAVILGAIFDARRWRHEYVTPEHLLLTALGMTEGAAIVSGAGGDPDRLRHLLRAHLDQAVAQVETGEVNQSAGFSLLLESAARRATGAGKDRVELGDLLVALYDVEDGFAAWFLQESGVGKYNLTSYLAHGWTGDEADPDEPPPPRPSPPRPGRVGAPAQSRAAANDGEPSTRPEGGAPGPGGESTRRLLAAYTTDLVAQARAGRLTPLVGRADLLRRMALTLCRRFKNNPVLVGEPGVGKTALAEGLAARIAAGDVPAPLRGARVLRLELAALLAGTRYRGDFEERIRKLLGVLEDLDDLVLFIDEIHTVVGAGAVSGGTLDAAALLKPALAGGRLRCIGATTHEEFRKHFERDRALARRFQRVEVPEPSLEETAAILEGLKPTLEAHHGVVYGPSALRAAVDLSGRFLPDRHQPDKAIDILDEAGAAARLAGHPPRPLGAGDIEAVVARLARVPAGSVNLDEASQLRALDRRLRRHIFGQEAAVTAVTEAIRRARAGFGRPEGPVASLLFVGPTGVGKTELARRLAETLAVPLIRFDMGEYQEKHTVSRLVGAPPGYVGHEEGGQLTEAIRRSPHAVLLLDEIEKAHPDIFNALLQVMDYATLTDTTGRRADFRHVIVIMTSNAGVRDLARNRPGFTGPAGDPGAVEKAVERLFAPEFRNRLDRVVHFGALDRAVCRRIVTKQLAEFRQQLRVRGVALRVSAPAVDWLAGRGHSPEYGAREVARLIQDQVKSHFVEAILFGPLRRGGRAEIGLGPDGLTVRFRGARPASSGQGRP